MSNDATSSSSRRFSNASEGLQDEGAAPRSIAALKSRFENLAFESVIKDGSRGGVGKSATPGGLVLNGGGSALKTGDNGDRQLKAGHVSLHLNCIETERTDHDTDRSGCISKPSRNSDASAFAILGCRIVSCRFRPSYPVTTFTVTF